MNTNLDGMFSPNGVFEMGYIRGEQPHWRAFYRVPYLHGDNPSLPDGCNYRHADGATPQEAWEKATAACIAERVKGRPRS